MSAPVGNTCPDIDKVIKGIEESEKSIKYIFKYIDELKSYDEYSERQEYAIENILSEVNDIESYLWSLVDIMEELRNANSMLRHWGEQLELELENYE